MHFTLPKANWRWDWFGCRTGCIHAFSSNLTRTASFHDDLDATANSNEKDRQSLKTLGTIYEDLPGVSVGVMVSYVDYDIQTQSAMSRDGFIQACEKHWNKRFEVPALSSRA